MDKFDTLILHCLDENARLPVQEIARMIGLSSPATRDRIGRLVERNIIQGYGIRTTPQALGYTLEAIVRIKPLPGHIQQVQREIEKQTRFTECHKITGDDCFIARLCLVSINELDSLLVPLHRHAETNTAIIKSTPILSRLPPILKD